ncbi:mercury resistance system periplasmic binding protein MerP [Pseudomonas turukhanskensis]|uniref:Periplasmic mercury ion-binding protein n=1 Tax=Pseudomonas turukhanskensis TaxID=1806536 RepID=A0A9W6KBQ7_9PSED|nr:mercury resistance system periplasmic binding protein MerP [Pseudomonas turukhanskensis]GLK91709.1 periplasmic mercury ion-binding protein [Pseudomonas turukhanskensis]
MRQLLIAAFVALPLASLAAPPKTVTLDVQNMTCPVCPITVRKSLEKVSGVSDVQVDFNQKTATVTYDPDKAQPEALTEATSNAGYPSTVQK